MSKAQLNQQKEKDQGHAPIIQNVVATVELDMGEMENLDLRIIARKCQNTQYNKNRFPAVIMRKTNPRTTGLIFSSGKIIIIGAKSVEESHESAKKITQNLQKSLNEKIEIKNIQVRNMVASCSMAYKINLQKLCYDDAHTNWCQYDDTFPGLIYTYANFGKSGEPVVAQEKVTKKIKKTKSKKEPKNRKVVALIFTSGKIVFTGAQNRQEIDQTYEFMQQILQQFRDKN